MKKLFLLFAAAMLTASVSAQRTTVTANKAGDNWYAGINAGVGTNMQKYDWENAGDKGAGFFKGFTPEFGVRIGKNLTTVFGLALDVNAYFLNGKREDGWRAKSTFGSSTFIDATDFDLMTTWNLNNAFAGYKGQPRTFEVIALVGGGYSRAWAAHEGGINAKAAIDFAFNLGANKAWQVYIEPSAILGEPGVQYANPFYRVGDPKKYNGTFSLKAGVNYKFGCSNGTHNFAIEQLRDQAEIDGLNAKINELRADNQAKDSKIAADGRTIQDLQAQLAACQARPTAAAVVAAPAETVLQPIVIFRQGKSTIDAAQYASIEMIAKYMKNHKDAKVKVQGYASPEGNKELNQKLSEKRAEAVKTALVKKYKIAADRVTIEGLGATDKLSQENDFNRVAMFVDTTK
ncbi:MAG: OmpA family protein [Prevotella sp.]|nr:OmpA family protein [Prevotella sp.]